MSPLRTAAALALLTVPAHAGGYVSPVPPLMSVEALYPGPSIAAPPPELLIAGVGLALLLFLLSRDGGDGSYAAPLPQPQPAPVPVPPAAPMLLAGLAALAVRRWGMPR